MSSLAELKLVLATLDETQLELAARVQEIESRHTPDDRTTEPGQVIKSRSNEGGEPRSDSDVDAELRRRTEILENDLRQQQLQQDGFVDHIDNAVASAIAVAAAKDIYDKAVQSETITMHYSIASTEKKNDGDIDEDMNMHSINIDARIDAIEASVDIRINALTIRVSEMQSAAAAAEAEMSSANQKK